MSNLREEGNIFGPNTEKKHQGLFFITNSCGDEVQKD
jgi:hypothetical protein